MKNKTILIISAIFISATFIYIGWQHRRINRLTDQNQLQAVELMVLNDSVSVYRDKNGELNYRLSVVEVSHNNLRESLEIAGWNIKQLKAKDIEWRRITNALKLRLETIGNGEAAIHDTILIAGKDTIVSNYFNWSNNYLTLNGTVIPDKVAFDYYYRTAIDVVQHRNRKGSMVTVSLADPNAAITSGNNVFLNSGKRWWEKPWLWGIIGFGAGYFVFR